ncbi:hypothetical protein BOTBODRAFT_338350 [Botryobasidium botryosum FD-172 SS1]|uniref:Uncharacterized protein n=1 Tax=Botryobasidium botryosum (strain FD-172 SS1) TaxID=930990 RepID=A0A067MFU5_BOTB1|nr:hypothetical protein BOTBODRAFT_338350 [Botryobasidium botryosum FD-172 SS1]
MDKTLDILYSAALSLRDSCIRHAASVTHHRLYAVQSAPLAGIPACTTISTYCCNCKYKSDFEQGRVRAMYYIIALPPRTPSFRACASNHSINAMADMHRVAGDAVTVHLLKKESLQAPELKRCVFRTAIGSLSPWVYPTPGRLSPSTSVNIVSQHSAYTHAGSLGDVTSRCRTYQYHWSLGNSREPCCVSTMLADSCSYSCSSSYGPRLGCKAGRLLELYLRVFSSGDRNRWKCRLYARLLRVSLYCPLR